MSNTSSPRAKSRVQTTVSILEEAVAGVDTLALDSGVSRSRLMDLAVRRFLRWAANLDPRDLQLIAEYEVTEPISGFVRRPTPPPMEAQAAPAPALEDTGPVSPRREARVPVEGAPRVRDRQGRYSDTPGRGR